MDGDQEVNSRGTSIVAEISSHDDIGLSPQIDLYGCESVRPGHFSEIAI